MKKITLILLSLFMLIMHVQAEDISLNGQWLFIADSIANYSSGIPADRAIQVVVPGTWNVLKGLEDYNGRCWYQRDINITANSKGRAVRLHFAGAYHDATVYLNGQLIGRHVGSGYTPFSFDISRLLRYGQPNRLCVCVDNNFSELNLPYQNKFDWAVDGGLFRSVWIHTSLQPSIRYVHVTPKLNLVDSTGIATFSIRLYEPKVKNLHFNLICREKKTGKIVFQTTQKAARQANGCFEWTEKFGKVSPWHFDHPNLYTFSLTVMDGQRTSDEKIGQFGFRCLELKGNQLVFNGEPVRLPGIEYMAGSNPRFGCAEPEAYLDTVVKRMKNVNTVITRFHWPQDDQLLTLMDEQGILVQEELPWWQQPNVLSPELTKIAQQQVDEMVEAHYNHPCIVMWGLSNEVRYNGESLKPVRREIESCDSTRLINVVCNHTDTQLEQTVTLGYSLPTWNEYTGTWNGNDRTALPGKLKAIENVLHGRPLFITELGCCEPAFSGGDPRRIDDMIYHLGEYTHHDYICGYVYFCLNDYRTQVGEEGYGRYRLRRHGITDMQLQPKPSYYQLQAIASPIEIRKVNSAGNGDRDANVSIHVRNTIPNYTLRGYILNYTDANGIEQSQALPILRPGSDYSLVLRNVGPSYHFQILRPGGYFVAGY